MKGFIILLGAGVLTLLLKRQSAATRHLVWFLSLVGVFLLPMLQSTLPEWRVAVIPPKLAKYLPASASHPAPVKRTERRESQISERSSSEAAASASTHTPGTVPANAESRPVSISISPISPAGGLSTTHLVWLAGTLLFVCPLTYGSLRMWRTSRRFEFQASESVASLVASLCKELGIKKSVTVLQTSQTTMPATWGFWSHTIVLPETFGDWAADRQRLVLLHELAHIKRLDCVTQSVAWIICAVFWFNPLVWLALRRMRVERERACDDIVLNQRIKASDYATHLLDIAHMFRDAVPASIAAVAMAKPTQLEGRLLAILEPRHNRNSLTLPKGLAITVVATVAIVSLAACRTAGSFLSRGTPSTTMPKFVRTTSYGSERGMSDVIHGDLNGDGRDDLLLLNIETNSISLFENTSSAKSHSIQVGERIDLQVGDMPFFAKMADIDGDGKADIVVSSHAGDFVSIFRNVHQGGRIGRNSFAPPVLLMTQRAPHFLDIDDLNHDGKPDLAVANNGHGRGNSISLFENTSSPGTISFATRVDITTGAQPVCVVLGDLDEDGWSDIVVGNHLGQSVTILPNLNRGGPIMASSFPQKIDLATEFAPTVIALSDLNGDGRRDIVLSYNTAVDSPCKLSLFKNLSVPGQMAFAARNDMPAGTNGAVALRVDDVNQDGWPDLLVGHNYGDGISIYLNRGESEDLTANSFAPAIQVNTGPFGGFNLTDLDLDGHLDLVSAEKNAATFSIYKSF